jgi:hypothetical protein
MYAMQPDSLRGAEDIVERVATEALESMNAIDEDNTKSGSQIYERAVQLYTDLEEYVPVTTFRQCLSRCVKRRDSGISRPPGKYGFYLISVANESSNDEIVDSITTEAEETVRQQREKEKLLYPVIRSWMQEQDYQAKITANLKGNGQWGNPDVTGISCDDAFGINQIEIVTVEAKLNQAGWKRWFFEAVSHRRFANRSYFAFAHPEQSITKLDEELRYYSELFRVGVLVISMKQEDYDRLQRGTLVYELINDDNVNVIELYSAPYSSVQSRYQISYLKCTLGLDSFSRLAKWGENE